MPRYSKKKALKEDANYEMIFENKENPEKNNENDSGKYKSAYTALVYETLFKILSGIPLPYETNFSQIVRKSIEHALKSPYTIESNNLIKIFASTCPSRIYESTDGKDNKSDVSVKFLEDLVKGGNED